jgi:hypothetical protein
LDENLPFQKPATQKNCEAPPSLEIPGIIPCWYSSCGMLWVLRCLKCRRGLFWTTFSRSVQWQPAEGKSGRVAWLLLATWAMSSLTICQPCHWPISVSAGPAK